VLAARASLQNLQQQAVCPHEDQLVKPGASLLHGNECVMLVSRLAHQQCRRRRDWPTADAYTQHYNCADAAKKMNEDL
jgi:hypothetical protein